MEDVVVGEDNGWFRVGDTKDLDHWSGWTSICHAPLPTTESSGHVRDL